MSNGHASANCVVVTVSNGIAFTLKKPLGYVNPFFLKYDIVAKRNGTVFLSKRQMLLAPTAGA